MYLSNNNMKRIIHIGSFLMLGILSACAPSAPDNTEPPAKLEHTPTGGQLTGTPPSLTVTSSLNCGCAFALTISGAGDTSIIKYSISNAATQLTSHAVTVSAPAGLAKGTYTSWLALQTPDPNVKFLRDTLRDTLIVP